LRQGGKSAEARLWNELKERRLGGFTDIFGNLGAVSDTILAVLEGKLAENIVASDLRYVKAK